MNKIGSEKRKGMTVDDVTKCDIISIYVYAISYEIILNTIST